MAFTNRPLFILVLLLVVSNMFWAYVYFVNMRYRDDALREGSNALGVILATVGALLKEYCDTGQTEYLGVAHLFVDRALLVAQTLNKLSGGSDWTRMALNAVASLHDLIADMHQGRRISKDKLMEVTNTLERLVEALRNFDIENIKQYSQKLEALAYGA